MFLSPASIPAKSWRSAQVAVAIEGCSLLMVSHTVPFGQTVHFDDWRRELSSRFDSISWSDSDGWDCVEQTRFNAPMGRQFRALVVRAPQTMPAAPCDLLWPIEAGLLGEAESLMLAKHPDSPPESCENLVWVLWRQNRLSILVCHEGHPAHWLVEDGWDQADGLGERLKRFSQFLDSDAYLGKIHWQWVFSADSSSDIFASALSQFPQSLVANCDLQRGLDHLQQSSLARFMPNMGLRNPLSQKLLGQRLRHRSLFASSVALVIVLLISWSGQIVDQASVQKYETARQKAQPAVHAQQVIAQRQDSLEQHAQQVGALAPIAGARGNPIAWFSMLSTVLPEGAHLESLSVESRSGGYILWAQLTVPEFSDADAVLNHLQTMRGVRSVKVGEKRKVKNGVRFHLEVAL